MKKRNEFKHTISFIENELSSGTFPGAALAVMLGDRQLVERRYWGSYSSRTRREIPGCSPNCHPCGHARVSSFLWGRSSTWRRKKANDRPQRLEVTDLSERQAAAETGCAVWAGPLYLQLGGATRSLETDAKSGDERQGYCTLTTECSCKRKTCPSSGEVKAPSPGVRLVNAGQKREGKAVDCKPMR